MIWDTRFNAIETTNRITRSCVWRLYGMVCHLATIQNAIEVLKEVSRELHSWIKLHWDWYKLCILIVINLITACWYFHEKFFYFHECIPNHESTNVWIFLMLLFIHKCKLLFTIAFHGVLKVTQIWKFSDCEFNHTNLQKYLYAESIAYYMPYSVSCYPYVKKTLVRSSYKFAINVNFASYS